MVILGVYTNEKYPFTANKHLYQRNNIRIIEIKVLNNIEVYYREKNLKNEKRIVFRDGITL